MDIQTQSYLLSAIICLAIAVSIQIRARRSRLHLYFVVLNAVLAAWNFGNFMDDVTGQTWWPRVALLSALAIPWTSLRFFQTFLGEGTTAFANAASNIAAVLSLLLVPFIISPMYANQWINLFLLVYIFGVLYLCMFLIYRRLRLTESRLEGARLWYLVIGGLVAITFSLTDYLPKIDVFFPTVGNVLSVIFMFFLSQILIQYRLLDLNEFFGKIAVLGLLVSLLAATYGVLIYFAGDQPGILFFTSVVSSFVVLILFEPLRMWVEDKISRYGVRERFDFSRQMATLHRSMANVLELGDLVQLIFEQFENTRRITHASLYLIENDAQTYKCVGFVGPKPAPVMDSVTAREVFDRMRTGDWLTREEIEDELLELGALGIGEGSGDDEERMQLAKLEAIERNLDELNAGVVFPIMSEERLIGFMCLWDARVREAFIADELELVQKVAQQVTIVVENSKLVEKLRERDRLAALGEMAAGLAHEIRNPLGAIKGAAQLLEYDTDSEESMEFLAVIVEEVDRLNNVVSQFLDYARPDRGASEGIDLNPCVDRTHQLIKQRAEEREVEVTVKLATELPQVRGDIQRLTQVFLNLAINAIEAMSNAEERRLEIVTAITRRRDKALGGTLERDVVEARFTDTGRGMTPEELRNIFIPFYTTKSSGTGLGLPICQRIIRSFGGTVDVTSTLDEGTAFSVQLPIWGEEAITGTTMRREPRRRPEDSSPPT